jgi:transposase
VGPGHGRHPAGSQQAAHQARTVGADQLDPVALAQIRNHYLGALAKGRTDNHGHRSTLTTQARRLIQRFTRYEDMILRFAVDLTVPFTNYADVWVMPMVA